MMRNIFKFSDDGGVFRRIPIVWHFFIVGSFLAIFQIFGEDFRMLLLHFNANATLSWESLITFLFLVGGYAVF